MLSILQLIRFPNLLITLLVQFFLYYFLVYEPSQVIGHMLYFDGSLFTLLALCTLLIMAGGYLINDWLDYDLDFSQRPQEVIIHQKVSIRTVKLLYGLFNGLAIIIIIYLALQMGDPGLGALLAGTIYLLYLYSRHLQKYPLIGNLVIAFLCGLTVWIVMAAAHFDLLMIKKVIQHRGELIFWIFGIFATLVTLWREIIKDLEDRTVDQRYGLKTLAHFQQGKVSHAAAVALGVITLLGLGLLRWSEADRLSDVAIYYLLGMMASTVFITIRILRSSQEKDYHLVSLYQKLFILQGLCFIFLWHD